MGTQLWVYMRMFPKRPPWGEWAAPGAPDQTETRKQAKLQNSPRSLFLTTDMLDPAAPCSQPHAFPARQAVLPETASQSTQLPFSFKNTLCTWVFCLHACLHVDRCSALLTFFPLRLSLTILPRLVSPRFKGLPTSVSPAYRTIGTCHCFWIPPVFVDWVFGSTWEILIILLMITVV